MRERKKLDGYFPNEPSGVSLRLKFKKHVLAKNAFQKLISRRAPVSLSQTKGEK
jgi:hypothetical protein